MIQGCDVIPIASKSDHLLVRLQMKQFLPSCSRTRRKVTRVTREDSSFAACFRSHLPLDPPSSLSDWQSQVLDVERAAKEQFQGAKKVFNHWDEKAKRLKGQRDEATGMQRRKLAKELYLYLKRKMA
eukprot:4815437-Amphidinium_carterae.1